MCINQQFERSNSNIPVWENQFYIFLKKVNATYISQNNYFKKIMNDNRISYFFGSNRF